jgi:hypothetical protein
MFIDEHGAQAWIRDTRLTPEQALRIARALDGELGAGIRLAALTLNGRKVAGAGRTNGGDEVSDKGSNDEYGQAGQAVLPTNIHPRRK